MTSNSSTSKKASLTFSLSAPLKPGLREVVEMVLSTKFGRTVKVDEPAPSATKVPQPYKRRT